MKPTPELPDDPALPGLVAIRNAGLAAAIPALGLDGQPVEFLLHRYHPGSRATLEARAGPRRFIVKTYATDPAPEATLYRVLASAGLAGGSGVRVPPLLAWERDLHVLVIGWLEGPTAEQLIACGQGERAGELAAGWLHRAASLHLQLGPPFGAPRRLEQVRKWAATLSAADAELGTVAGALAKKLAQTQPKENSPRLVQGSLYAHHVIDLGDGPGLIDWQKSGHGPAELDAGIFLATVWRLGLRGEPSTAAAARAEAALLARTANLLDQRALAWHRASTLLRLAKRLTRRAGNGEWRTGAETLLGEATRLAAAAG